jgi:hypothetical protein
MSFDDEHDDAYDDEDPSLFSQDDDLSLSSSSRTTIDFLLRRRDSPAQHPRDSSDAASSPADDSLAADLSGADHYSPWHAPRGQSGRYAGGAGEGAIITVVSLVHVCCVDSG